MLTNRTAVVTGASSGIGAALARLLAREGATVVAAARRKERLDALAADVSAHGGNCLPVVCDVTDRAQAEGLVARALASTGRLDILVNNAGRGHLASVEETTDETVQRIFAVNVFALWHTTRPALPHMRRQQSGHIINIASMAGKLGYPFNSAYVAAKHACVGFTHALRMELVGTPIHATVVCPAGVKTEWADMTEGAPMLPLLSASGPLARQIAAEQQIALPAIEGVMPAEAVAEKILTCIYHPVAEVYTHRGSQEFALLAARDRAEAERHQAPAALAERAVYEAQRRGGG